MTTRRILSGPAIPPRPTDEDGYPLTPEAQPQPTALEISFRLDDLAADIENGDIGPEAAAARLYNLAETLREGAR